MRPFQIILIAVFVVLAALGLYLFATFKGFGGSGVAVGAVSIWGTLPEASVSASLASIKQGDKAYGQVTYVEKRASTFESELADALAAGTGPDLIIITQEQLLSTRNKLSVVPYSSISERTYRDTYLPIASLFLTGEGTYGIPYVVDPLVLYYNKTLLQNAGVSLPPSSWEAVVGLAPTLTQKSDAQVISKSLIPLGTYGNIENARAILSLLFLQAGSTISENGAQGVRSSLSKSNAASSSGVSPIESALGFYTQFANPAKTVYTWNRSLTSARQSFLAGDATLYIGYASEQRALRAANPNLNFDMGLIPQPQTAQVKTDYALAYAFAFPKVAKNAAGAYQVALSLAASTQVPAVAQSLGMAPAQRALLTPPARDLYAPIFYPLALLSTGWLSPSPAVTDSIFGTMIGNIVSGRQEPGQALSDADKTLNAAL